MSTKRLTFDSCNRIMFTVASVDVLPVTVYKQTLTTVYFTVCNSGQLIVSESSTFWLLLPISLLLIHLSMFLTASLSQINKLFHQNKPNLTTQKKPTKRQTNSGHMDSFLHKHNDHLSTIPILYTFKYTLTVVFARHDNGACSPQSWSICSPNWQ